MPSPLQLRLKGTAREASCLDRLLSFIIFTVTVCPHSPAQPAAVPLKCTSHYKPGTRPKGQLLPTSHTHFPSSPGLSHAALHLHSPASFLKYQQVCSSKITRAVKPNPVYLRQTMTELCMTVLIKTPRYMQKYQ